MITIDLESPHKLDENRQIQVRREIKQG
jgi:hypothetical protein